MSMDWLWAMPRTKEEAKSMGEKHYFTGKACLRGHITYRFTSSRICSQCGRESVGTHNARNPEKKIAKSKESRISVDTLERHYVAALLAVPTDQLTDELYELKKAQLTVYRAIKETYL